MIDKEDLLIAGGAVAAFFGLNWLMKRQRVPPPSSNELPTPAALPAVTQPPQRITNPARWLQPAPTVAAQAVQPATSRFTLGTGLRTIGPYPEIGFRVGSVTATTTGRIPKGQFAGTAEGKAFRFGPHVFERLNRQGQTVFIVQQLLEPMTRIGPVRQTQASPIRSLFPLKP